MKPVALICHNLEVGRWHKSIGTLKSKNKVAWALPSTQRPDSDLNSSPLPSTFKTFLSVAAWSEVWPYSYVSCRTCATPPPPPPYRHHLPSFSHLRTPFPLQICTSLDV